MSLIFEKNTFDSLTFLLGPLQRPITINRPITKHRPVTEHRPATINSPVTEQRPITINRPVTEQRPITINRPVTEHRHDFLRLRLDLCCPDIFSQSLLVFGRSPQTFRATTAENTISFWTQTIPEVKRCSKVTLLCLYFEEWLLAKTKIHQNIIFFRFVFSCCLFYMLLCPNWEFSVIPWQAFMSVMPVM